MPPACQGTRGPGAAALLADGDLDRAIVVRVGVLDVDPGATLVGRIEVQTRELRSGRAIRRPPTEAFAGIVQVAVLVQVLREPDVVIDAMRCGPS